MKFCISVCIIFVCIKILIQFHFSQTLYVLNYEEYKPVILETAIIPHKKIMKRICYYAIPRNNSWDKTLENLPPDQIDPTLCTHIIIAFAKVENKTIVPYSNLDFKTYNSIIDLKKYNPELKVMLSINGGFPDLVKSKESVDIFAFNACQFLHTYKFDGLDLDWEFPSWPFRLRTRNQKNQFTYLVIQLWNALKLASHPPLVLSLAVAAQRPIVKRSYEIEILAENVDFFNLMGYDFRMYWPYFPFTGYNAPLHKTNIDIGYLATLNIESAAEFWISKGAPKEKLVVGIPTYGRTWKLLSFLWHKLGAAAVGSGMDGGYITYPKALAFLKKGALRVFDEEAKVPYSSMGRDWASYEDKQSIYEKVMWIKNGSFAGVMTWNLNCDDYLGTESGRPFDLHHVIKDTLLAVSDS